MARVNSRTLLAGQGGSPPADRNARQQEHESWACPVERHENQWILPTVNIPLIPVIAFFWESLGVERDAAMGVLGSGEACHIAVRVGQDSPIHGHQLAPMRPGRGDDDLIGRIVVK
jgi:hypothetical protein